MPPYCGMHLVLVQPQIAPNTGNIIRLAANCGAALHLVEPLGFRLDEKAVRRAGLDYHELAELHVHRSLDDVRSKLGGRQFAVTASATRCYSTVEYRADDAFFFGSEQDGFAEHDLDSFQLSNRISIPMRDGNRSLNLANACSVVIYEAWRQLGFVTGD